MNNQETALMVKENKENIIEYIPETDIASNLIERIKCFQKLVHSQLDKGKDYGSIPFVTDKLVLFKSGGEKINRIMGNEVICEPIKEEENWEKPFFSYTYKATILKNGMPIENGYGKAHSMEKSFTLKRVKDKKNGQYRKPNDEEKAQHILDNVNSIYKRAEKRAYLDATLKMTGLSNIFTQDLEDMQESSPQINLNDQIKIFLYEIISNENLIKDYRYFLISNSDLRNDAIGFITNTNPQNWREIDPMKLKTINGMIHKNYGMLVDKLNKHFEEIKDKISSTGNNK